MLFSSIFNSIVSLLCGSLSLSLKQWSLPMHCGGRWGWGEDGRGSLMWGVIYGGRSSVIVVDQLVH
jgi:hypothetical protein